MTNIVKINGTDMQVIEHQGQRVATLAQIDAVHSRPEGTARKRFNDNRDRFIEGDDFIKLSASEIRTRFPGVIAERATEDVTLITEQGYLMLVKSFTDDLAWQVQRQVVTGYFRAKEAAALPPAREGQAPRVSERYREAAAITRDSLKIYKLLGVDDGMAKVIAAKEVRNATGLDFTPLLANVTATNNPRLTVKELTERIGGSATSEMVNSALEQLGLQKKEHWTNSKGQPRSKWVVTEAGQEYGALMPYQAEGHQHSGLRPVWFASVIALVQPLVEIAIAERSAPKAKRATVAQKHAAEPQGALL
jgi:hypothetical protein